MAEASASVGLVERESGGLGHAGGERQCLPFPPVQTRQCRM